MGFETIGRDAIRYDCRFYTGYRPCKKSDTCVDCRAFVSRGTRILIVKLGAMGDVLRTTCVPTALRKAHSPCHITWITAPESRDLLLFNPSIDRVLTVSLADVLGLEIESFDLVLNFDKDPEALALATRYRARERRGFAPHPETGALTVFNDASMYAWRLGLSDELKFATNTKTYPRIVFEMAELEYDGEEYALGVDPESRERMGRRVEAWLAEANGANANRGGEPRILGLNTGCGARFATKQWTVEGFAGLARLVLERHPESICFLLGGEREREFNRAVREKVAHPRLIDTGADNSLRDFVALVERCDAVVSSDSLAMHIAIALQKPTVALFGPTAHQEVDLFGRGAKIVTDFPCAPCYLRTCPHSTTCMEALESETVLEAVAKALFGR